MSAFHSIERTSYDSDARSRSEEWVKRATYPLCQQGSNGFDFLRGDCNWPALIADEIEDARDPQYADP